MTSKALNKLTPTEYRALVMLNMGNNGIMRYSLQDNRHNPNAFAVMAKEGTKILGWALMVPCNDEFQYHLTPYQKKKAKYLTQFYVRPRFRNRGIGTRIMAGVKKIEPVPNVIPHDDTSADFFEKFKVVTNEDGRMFLREAKKKKRRAA